FDTLGDCLDTHHLAYTLDRLDDRAVHPIAADVAHKRPIDLQVVYGQRLEIGERGHAAAEIIQRDRRAEITQAGHELRGAGQIADRGGFGQLEADLRSRQLVLLQATVDVIS